MTSAPSSHIQVPLGENAHRWAKEFAAEQETPEKGKQVYLNTLAVYAVHSYLKWLQVETDLTQGDSWNPGMRSLFDVADLVVPDVGKLECRPVLPGEEAVELPWEVTQDRVGYVAIQFEQQLDRVLLLGFALAIADDEPQLHLTQLQSLETLIDTLHGGCFVNLRQWLEGIFDKDWQAPELVLALRSSSFRSPTGITKSISRAKKIHLAGQLLLLGLQLIPQEQEIVDIRLSLYSGSDVFSLPEKLQVILFDGTGTPCMEAQATSTDNLIELEFTCQPKEKFSVKLVLGRMSLTEQFIV